MKEQVAVAAGVNIMAYLSSNAVAWLLDGFVPRHMFPVLYPAVRGMTEVEYLTILAVCMLPLTVMSVLVNMDTGGRIQATG